MPVYYRYCIARACIGVGQRDEDGRDRSFRVMNFLDNYLDKLIFLVSAAFRSNGCFRGSGGRAGSATISSST